MQALESSCGMLCEIAAGVLPGSGRPAVERAEAGVSTPVYRISRGGTTLYLRLAEGPGAGLAPEALAHDLLRALGVRVPEVVHFEPFNQDLGRSVMVTAEVPGRSLAEHHQGVDVGAVLAAAGRDLAVVNGLAVEGFGWVRRDRPGATRLEAGLPTLRAFALGELEEHLAALPAFLAAAEIRAVRRAVARHDPWLEADRAVLAHGDLDATHIYHRDGEYSGLIDLGEIRGAAPLYDLGHFALHDGETLPVLGLPALLAGYREVSPLPDDHLRRIHLSALLIGIRALARASERPPAAYHRAVVAGTKRMLAALLA